jgi:hypothetical protein
MTAGQASRPERDSRMKARKRSIRRATRMSHFFSILNYRFKRAKSSIQLGDEFLGFDYVAYHEIPYRSNAGIK